VFVPSGKIASTTYYLWLMFHPNLRNVGLLIAEITSRILENMKQRYECLQAFHQIVLRLETSLLALTRKEVYRGTLGAVLYLAAALVLDHIVHDGTCLVV
jgi:hypothetical protein